MCGQDTGRLKLADFGVSQMVQGNSDDSDLISKSAGTPAFMAPGKPSCSRVLSRACLSLVLSRPLSGACLRPPTWLLVSLVLRVLARALAYYIAF